MVKIQNNKAFTLVELIVVITILAILWTIAFISLQWYSSQARDSKRVSDIQNIKKSLELFSLNTWKYPMSDDYFTVSYGSQDLRYQWTVWEQVTTNLSRNLNEKPIDPLTGAEYIYSRTYAGTEYEVLSIYESDLISISPQPSPPKGEGARPLVFSNTYAANVNYPKINGNYNNLYLKAWITYLPTPSIINGNIWENTDILWNSTFLESQVITAWDNIPWVSTWWLNWMTVNVFTWELDTRIWEDDNGNKALLGQAIVNTYSWTILVGDWIYQEVVEVLSWDYVNLVDIFVMNKDNFIITDDWLWDTTPNLYLSCTWENIPTPFSAITKYPWCDTADITVCSWNGTWYTISACNVWTTTASIDRTISWWNYFQWWRNKWFPYGDDSHESTPIPNENYNPNNDEYWFVNSRDWIVTHDNNLWWDNSWAWTDEQRQWPCADWYHVPSYIEWTNIIIAWQWWNNWANMQISLKLPYADSRSRTNNYYYDLGSDGAYWSSSPYGDRSYRLYFRYNWINPANNDIRGKGFPVRCFKN